MTEVTRNDEALGESSAGISALSADLATLLTRAERGIEETRKSVAEAEEQVRALKARMKESLGIAELLTTVLESQQSGHPSRALRSLRANARVIEAMRGREQSAGELMRAMETGLDQVVNENFRTLLTVFPGAAKAAGLVIDPTSKHPKYSFEALLLSVEFDKARLEARITSPGGRRVATSIDVDLVVEHLVSEKERLLNRPFSPDVFGPQLLETFKGAAASADSSGPDGAVPIKAFLEHAGTNKDFRVDEFLVDLSRFVRTETSGVQIKLDHTRDSSRGVQLWQLEDRGFYGYIRVE